MELDKMREREVFLHKALEAYNRMLIDLDYGGRFDLVTEALAQHYANWQEEYDQLRRQVALAEMEQFEGPDI